MNLVITIIIYILIIIFDFIPLLKRDNKKIILFYLGTYLFTFIILILHSLNIVIPSPTKLIESIIKEIF